MTVKVTAKKDREELRQKISVQFHRYLVSANADLEEEDTFGNTPLICAAEKGVAELLALLLTHGCDVNRMSHSAATALHYAAQHGAVHCCKVLLEAGAEIDAQVKKIVWTACSVEFGSGAGWVGLGWAGLGWAGLGWAGLGWAGLG